MSEDLNARIPGQALMEQLVVAQDDGTIIWLPFGIVYPSDAWGSASDGSARSPEFRARVPTG